MWDKDPDLDDALHHPDPPGYTTFTVFSWRGWVNAVAIFIIVLGLLGLFIGFPIVVELSRPPSTLNGFNIGGINGSGQIPDLPGLRRLIDPDTPESALTRIGDDGLTYDLAFSDEFNLDGRTFYPGDDPFWEAVDLHYWPTTDVEWYDPSAVTTKDGKMVITMTQQFSHDLNFQSGMVTTWNKLCFNTGYIEISVSLPGTNRSPGLWPGAWTLGNLGRAGFGGSTEGLWPYTYDTCDTGTFPNQITKDRTPASSLTGGQDGGLLSAQPGQKLSACTCPGSDHPGPSHNVGRGAPEIDIIEGEIDVSIFQAQMSQSFQCAPYDASFGWNSNSPAATVFDSNITRINSYRGGPFQQSMSALSYVNNSIYGDFTTFGFEYWSDPNHRDDGYITWYSEGRKTWTATAASIGPNEEADIGQRLISEEPMYVILNLGQSPDFQKPDFKHLTFPAQYLIDYVRIYQRRGLKNGITCDPPNRPTTDYINRHMNVYTNPNITTWEQANLTFPRNSLYDGC
ncbi:glycoside hydrolase family 16 protein [Panaeolus papilionaceus]|nr:glycoside hydrolase family 16 protein [Panaeolus papilionaceus]